VAITIEAGINKKTEQLPKLAPNEKVNGANALMQALVDNGTKVIFGYPGGAIMPGYDALYGYQNRIRHILARHEQGATHMAEGYARMKGEPGVVLVTSGPGATNTFTGLRDAQMDSTPLVVIAGQVAREKVGTEAFQEAPVVEASTPFTKWSYQVKDAQEIPAVMDRAFAIARSGRPGPVFIDIPRDVQLESAEYTKTYLNGEYAKPALTPDKLAQLQQATQLLNHAQRPYILAGHGVLLSNSERDLLNAAERAGIPVANTLLGLSSFPADHPLFVGMLGMHGKYGANVLTNQADVILAVGMRFDDRVTGVVEKYAPNARIIHVDIEKGQLGKVIKHTELPINLDAKTALSVLSGRLEEREHIDWLNRFRELDDVEYQAVIKDALSQKSPNIQMAEVVDLLSQQTNGQAVVVADVGQHQMIAAQYYKARKTNSYLTSGGMGTMGYALPAAIGAKIAAPEREVVAVTGDGSFQMTLQELGVVMQERIPVKMVILDNTYLGMVRQWQDSFFGQRHSQVDIQSPDFVTLASSYRISGEKVERRQDLRGSVDRMLSSNEAYILHIMVDRQENVYPMMPPGAAVDGILLK
jgi:acetolactate synthase I/II/III large subunit